MSFVVDQLEVNSCDLTLSDINPTTLWEKRREYETLTISTIRKINKFYNDI